MSEFIKIIIHNLFTSVGFSYITETDMWPFFLLIFFFSKNFHAADYKFEQC